MNACIVCNGEIRDYGKAKERIRGSQLVIAADGGLTHLKAMGMLPHVVIGDMDSLVAGLWSENELVEHLEFPADKDKSDAELAIDLAFERGCEFVSLLGATGGRLDHELGNVSLLAKYPGRTAIVEGGATLVAVDRSQKCVLHGKPGAVVSLIPFPTAKQVTTQGLEYGLVKHDLPPGTRGVSNLLCQTEACICVGDGLLLVYMQSAEA
jgi:thiamine pyrophosphokinase